MWLVIEFVPKSDSQVSKLLKNREDVFGQYNQADFEQAFSEYYYVTEAIPVKESERTLYLLQKRK